MFFSLIKEINRLFNEVKESQDAKMNSSLLLIFGDFKGKVGTNRTDSYIENF